MVAIKKVPLLPSPARAADRTSRVGVAHSKARLSIKSGESHPAAEDLEEYYFGRLTWYQRNSIEAHLARCAACSQELQDLEMFVGALSSAIQGTLILQQLPVVRSRSIR